MADNDIFFAEQSEQSSIKAKIVTSYFTAWSRVMKNNWPGYLGYIDLFCGPGEYSDHTPSAPVQIVKNVLSDANLVKRMLFVFNDKDKESIDHLKSTIESIDQDRLLNDNIQYLNEAVASGFDDRIHIPDSVPVLSFIDPFGYKGLTLDLIHKLIASNGSDCIFFFNYNRINMALSNTKFDDHLKKLFGDKRTDELKAKLASLSAIEREPIVLDGLVEALRDGNNNYVLPFKFYGKEQTRTSHFIIFVTKHPTACKIMKQIMYTNSAKDADGVATFSFEDSKNFGFSQQLSMFDNKLKDLESMLVSKYCGRRMLVSRICEDVQCDFTNFYVEQNVKAALVNLENAGKLEVDGRKVKMRAGKICMPNTATVVFK